MNNSEYFSHDALGLAELVRTKQISSTELLEALLKIFALFLLTQLIQEHHKKSILNYSLSIK